MKKVFGVMRRTVQKFNVDNRAQRVIEKEKPTPAPRHDSHLDSAKLHEVEEDEASQQLNNKFLVDRMNQLSVKSLDNPIEIKSAAKSGKSMPESREKVPMPEFGYEEPTSVPAGRVSLKYALEFISSRHEQPDYSAQRFAEETGVPESQAQAVLKHFQMLSVRLPSSSDSAKPNPLALPDSKPIAISDDQKPKV